MKLWRLAYAAAFAFLILAIMAWNNHRSETDTKEREAQRLFGLNLNTLANRTGSYDFSVITYEGSVPWVRVSDIWNNATPDQQLQMTEGVAGVWIKSRIAAGLEGEDSRTVIFFFDANNNHVSEWLPIGGARLERAF